MKINKCFLDTVAVRRSQYPTEGKPEFLLVGRSNVGKSSFINTIIEQKNLARTSQRPGKTQTLNFYLVNDSFYLVDVPGYGYASVNQETQKKMGLMIEEYLEKRKEMKRVFMLVDFRIKPTENDVMMYEFLKYYNIPVTLVLTKVDKVSPSRREKNLKVIKNTIELAVGDDLVLFSSVNKTGRNDILKIIENLVIETI
ncbi:MAG: ribosome biogenesis GTP-binding protein YihA/YsxC [Erysipelotrichaceae bacterium]|nr:ribosome biogenesis GTP-binding protein YihA/YsxC [Erysipelotrichaceae bacterium]